MEHLIDELIKKIQFCEWNCIFLICLIDIVFSYNKLSGHYGSTPNIKKLLGAGLGDRVG